VTLIPASILARLTIWVWGSYAVWQGLGIWIEGPARFGGPSFATLREAPNPTMTWGLSLTVSGLLMIGGSVLQSTRSYRAQTVGLILKNVGCLGVAFWSVVFAIGALNARQENPTVPGTGGRTYIAIAVTVLILAFVDERKRVRYAGGSQTNRALA
jgi:hypothetical protein